MISEITAHLHLPNFTELQNMEQSKHIILYFCDLWAYISSNIKEKNIQDFSSFLLLSRRMSCSIIFEFHSFPWGMKQDINQTFQLYLANSTIIFLTKNISDQEKLNRFKQRYLNKHIQLFEKAQKLADYIIENSDNKDARPYVCLQKDISQKYRLLRVDIFNENIICILD